MAKTNVEIQDYQGNVIHPKTSSEVVDYKESNVSVTLDELVARKKVFVQNEQPETDGVWFDTSDNQGSTAEESPIVKNIRDYIDGNIKPPIDKNTQDIKTMSEKLDTGLNTLSQLSNPNLLINGDFQVWQRGTSFTGLVDKKYYADRWRYTPYGSTVDISKNCTLTKTDEGLQMNVKGLESQQNTIFGQPLEYITVKKLLGKTVTFSICVKYNNLTQIHLGVNFKKLNELENTSVMNINSEGSDYVVFNKTITVPNDAEQVFPQVLLSSNKGDSSYTIKYIKLEIGDKVTPFIPKKYGEELALCQRYYIKNPSDSWFEFNRSQGGGLRCYIPTPSMRTVPSLIFPSDNIEIYDTTSVWLSLPKEKCTTSYTYTSNICLYINTNEANLKEFRSYIARQIPSFDAEIY